MKSQLHETEFRGLVLRGAERERERLVLAIFLCIGKLGWRMQVYSIYIYFFKILYIDILVNVIIL